MNIDNKYDIGEIVYLVTDIENTPRIVVSIEITKRELVYNVYAGALSSRHYEFEMSAEKSYA